MCDRADNVWQMVKPKFFFTEMVDYVITIGVHRNNELQHPFVVHMLVISGPFY